MQWVCGEGHEWEARVACVASGKSHCPECTRKNFTSQPEKQINNYIQQTHKTTTRDRRALPGHEIDIYIPDKKIGIEFNGLYWHTENNGKHRTYHHSKWLAAKNAGIQLIQIWEDDWKHDPELIKRMLDHKLGVTQQRVVYARKTTLTTLNTEQARRFLETNHIQNFASGTYYLGLEDLKEKELVAVLVLKKEAGTDGRTLNIIRYATSCNVVGGFTKLLKHAERTHKPDSFITFADHTVSDGGLYENNGFTPDKQIPPDYTYMVNNKRKHKFSYRLKRFREDPILEYREGLTERELAALNNIPRIWDAGKTRYRKTITENSAENK